MSRRSNDSNIENSCNYILYTYKYCDRRPMVTILIRSNCSCYSTACLHKRACCFSWISDYINDPFWPQQRAFLIATMSSANRNKTLIGSLQWVFLVKAMSSLLFSTIISSDHNNKPFGQGNVCFWWQKWALLKLLILLTWSIAFKT